MHIRSRIEREINEGKSKGLHRSLKKINNLIDFTSNDYLGAARSKKLSEAIKKLTSGDHNGSSGSRLLSGNSELAEQTEMDCASFFKRERALIFNSGYTANLALFQALPKRGDTVIYDEESHACIKDGIRLSMANRFPFKHNDVNDLERKLRKSSGQLFIAVESIYSMSGEKCPLHAIAKLAVQHNSALIVDEAHSTGLYGKNGEGLVNELSLGDQVFATVYTFGKAMGIHGAAICAEEPTIEYLINKARPFIYTTAPPPHFYRAIHGVLNMDRVEQRAKLHDNIQFFHKEANALKHKFDVHLTDHAIQSIHIPGASEVKEVAQHLHNNKLDVRAIVSPTVKAGTERLRICLHSFNTEKEIRLLIDNLASL